VALPTVGFCSDEDVALRAGADLPVLLPADQAYAAGNDGVFASGTRWLLASVSAAFSTQGVAAGMIASLSLPVRGQIVPDQTFIVDSVAVGGATLRRKGLASGAGQPPAPVGGATAVPFTVSTFAPQILRASYDLDQRLGLTSSSVLADPTQLTQACVLTVLWPLYEMAARRETPEAKTSEDRDASHAQMLWAKSRSLKNELEELLGRLTIQLSTDPVGQTLNKFGMRVSR